MNKDLIVEIFVPTLGSNGSDGMIATGYPVARNRILTARHPFYPDEGPARDPAFPIEIRWHYPGAALDWQAAEDIAWESECWDLVLLDCQFPADVAANRGFLSEALRFAVSEAAGPATEDAWKGASGAPVFVDWRILGVIASVPPDLRARRLDVVSMWRVLREEADFRREIGFEDHRQRHQSILDALKERLSDSNASVEALAQRCPEFKARVDAEATKADKTALLDEGLLRLEVPHLIQACQQAHVHLGRDPAAEVLTEIIQILLPAVYDHGVVETVRNACGEVTIEPPLVIITTNEERALPDAFIRRCLVLHLVLPSDQEALTGYLVERAQAHFPTADAALLEQAAALLIRDRDTARREHWLPLPGQAEYLDLVRIVLSLTQEDPGAQLDAAQLLEALSGYVLEKHPDAFRRALEREA